MYIDNVVVDSIFLCMGPNMELDEQERARICTAIQEKYAAVAQSPAGLFQYPTGGEGLLKQGYPAGWLARLPAPVQESFCGVGNPLSLGTPTPGQRVLDVGCGAGVDALLAPPF
jgi:2-polyprenyl-3-methyl-5-hydroxy-6-metoxy-1,4-benzoquinol methylase